MSHLLDMDAGRIASLIQQGKVSSREVTEAYIRHLLTMNQTVNGLTQDRFSLAREEAARADAQLRAGEVLGRLHGVPITVKECFHVSGMRTTGGLLHRRELIEEEDADVIAMLKREGAIILGKTNTPALCFCQETDNKLHGRTNNPWNLQRTAGGSSGGEGALIAAGGAAVGIGADIGGSIRFPSHFNGVVGFKSGNNQVSARGNFPEVTIPYQQRMLGIGAMAKSVNDARIIHEIIASEPLPHPSGQSDLSSFHIMIPGRQRKLPLGIATDTALRAIREQLSGDFRIGEDMPPHFADGARIWQEIMSIEGAKHIRMLMSDSSGLSPVKEYLKEKFRGGSDIHHYLSWALIGANMFKPSSERIQDIQRLLDRGDSELAEYFAKRIVILPVYHCAAPLHGQLYKEIFSVRKTYMKYMPYVAYANVWGLPALTVPVWEDEDGMPIGVQLITRNGNEEALFQLGEILERHFRGYVRCRKQDDAVLL